MSTDQSNDDRLDPNFSDQFSWSNNEDKPEETKTGRANKGNINREVKLNTGKNDEDEKAAVEHIKKRGKWHWTL
eukprot:14551540-Ditylum_brightwellii.AAC.1